MNMEFSIDTENCGMFPYIISENSNLFTKLVI